MNPWRRPAFILTLFALLYALPSSAQLEVLAKTTPEQRADFQTDFMKKKLDLSAEQAETVSEINLSMATGAEPVLKGDAARYSKAIEIRKLEAKRERKLRAALSEEQFKRFRDSKGELRDAMLEHFRSGEADDGS